MSKKLIFILPQKLQQQIRFGEYMDLIHSCYFRGKELGFEDNNIYLQWFDKIAFSSLCKAGIFLQCPSYSILPIQFIKKENIKLEEYDMIIDLNKEDAFFKGSKPMYIGPTNTWDEYHKQITNYSGYLNYKNKYFLDTGKKPIFNIPKDNLKKKYILFHIRLADWNDARNADLNIFYNTYKTLKEKYKNIYEFYKCGETYPAFDKKFDLLFPYFIGDINKFIKIMNNCSLFIGSESGPLALAESLGIPFIILNCKETAKYPGKYSFYHEKFWSTSGDGGIYGKTSLDWMDTDKIKIIWRGNPNYVEEVLEFAKRFL